MNIPLNEFDLIHAFLKAEIVLCTQPTPYTIKYGPA